MASRRPPQIVEERFVDARPFISIVLATAILALPACERSAPGTDAGAGPGRAGEAPPWFEECAAERGLDFVYDSGHRYRYLLPECMGGGVALFDMDGDGDIDVYFVQGGAVEGPAEERPPNELFRNRGDGSFENATVGSGAGDRGYGMGVACGDYDDDGDVDLYVTNVGANVLLRNRGDGVFEDVTVAAGVGHTAWGTGAAFLDHDDDGDLDLFVLNYVDWSIETEQECYNFRGAPDYCPPASYESPVADVLYRNDGNGVFTDVSDSSGVGALKGTGLGVVCGDFTGDGFDDVFVANDGMRNRFWVNHGDGTFSDVALEWGCAYDNEGMAKAGMGVTAGDVDRDGDLDLLVCNLANETDSFFLNQDGVYFIDSTVRAGLGSASRPYTRFGMVWADFDDDGALDLYQGNGRIERMGYVHADDPYADPNLLLRGHPGPRFEAVRPMGGTASQLVHTSRGVAVGDLDADGALDLVVVNRDSRAYLLRNVLERRGRWIGFRVVDGRGRDALGAIVRLTVGERRVRADVRAASSYLASSDPRIHVGLDEADRVDDVVVEWVDGVREAFGGFESARIVELERGRGAPVD